MKISDIIIVVGILGGVFLSYAGFYWVGAGCVLVALLVGWKRKWPDEHLDGILDNSNDSDLDTSDSKRGVDD